MTPPRLASDEARTLAVNAAALGAALMAEQEGTTTHDRPAWFWYTGDIATLATALTEAELEARASTFGTPPYNEVWPDFESVCVALAKRAGNADAMTVAQARIYVQDAIRESW